ncbi:unnamed protein product [Bursaphelenchus xylophilus]|uniref:Glyoxylate reductase/hydroxypyruvate reductase n=1 Tax=Bursaphelenchus xylophilus TaxID=6326 RepID=A0A1I7RKI8_BURXY|nr:unnamed protein product [Bursaphelenchus xylophilus]CAG9131294.1 unnamed protein product [Bursaphelenchus xylophilus]
MATKPKVVLTNSDLFFDRLEKIADVACYRETKQAPREWVKEQLQGAVALYGKGPLKIDADLLDHGPNLKYVVTISVGYENIDVEECKKRKIRVGYAGGLLAEATSETALTLLLTTSRRIPEALEAAKTGAWSKEWAPFWMCGKALTQTTVGILGLGRIGEAVAKKIEAFSPAKIIYHNRNKRSDLKYEYVAFDELLKQSDFLIITLSCGPDVEGLFDANAFKLMKNDSIVINVARGKVIKTDDLYEALKNGTIGAAGLDVTDPEPLPPTHPLYSLKNCVIFPHIGSANHYTRNAMLKLGEQNVIDALEGREMTSPLI